MFARERVVKALNINDYREILKKNFGRNPVQFGGKDCLRVAGDIKDALAFLNVGYAGFFDLPTMPYSEKVSRIRISYCDS